MARATTRTLLPLDRFARVVGIHPLHFNQVEVANLAPTTDCGGVYLQHSWQSADGVGREEIAQAIAQAEEQLARELRFDLMPVYNTDERQYIPRPYLPEMYGTDMVDIRGMWIPVQLDKSHVITGGAEVKTLIAAGRPITYSDLDGDTYAETATITVVTTVTNPEEIFLYYPGESGEDEWEIRPITVTIAGGIATIVCRREQLVDPDFMEMFGPRAVDGLDNTKFISTVDIYRKYNNPATQVIFYWYDPKCTAGAAATIAVQNGAFATWDRKLGIVRPEPATWNTTTLSFDPVSFTETRQPDKAIFYYRAGWRYKGLYYNVMDPMWERIISHYALTFLDRPLCSCQTIKDFLTYWKEDYSLSQSNTAGSVSWRKPSKLLNCPLGTTRAAFEAWNYIQKYKVA